MKQTKTLQIAAALLISAPLALPMVTPAQASPAATNPQFADTCMYSHTNKTDPILYPNQGPVAHQHIFFANRSTTDTSTPATLRADPRASTCKNRPQTDKSAYWAPALYLSPSNTQQFLPTVMRIYYRPGVKDSLRSSIVPFDPNFSMIAGNAMSGGPQDTAILQWSCVNVLGPEYPPLDHIPDGCADQDPDGAGPLPPESTLRMTLFFPSCWDGNTSFPWGSHTMDHMAYSVNPDGTGRVCPAGFSTPVPQIEMGFRWDVTSLNDATGLQNALLASDFMQADPAKRDGRTGHADFMNGWDQTELTELVEDCLHAGLHCGNQSKLDH